MIPQGANVSPKHRGVVQPSPEAKGRHGMGQGERVIRHKAPAAGINQGWLHWLRNPLV